MWLKYISSISEQFKSSTVLKVQDNYLRKLLLHLSFKDYLQVSQNARFNLKPQLKTPPHPHKLAPNLSVQITLILSPDHWNLLPKEIQDTQSLINHLQKLSTTNPQSELLQTESWMALKVTQQQAEGETGYRTMWDYVNWEAIKEGGDQGQLIFEAFTAFAKDSGLTESLPKEVGEGQPDLISNAISGVLGSNVKGTDNPLGDVILESLQETLGELFGGKIGVPPQKAPVQPDQALFKQLVQFFVDENWGFSRVGGEEEVHIQFQGNHGSWMCAARVLSENKQMLFYSYYPQPVTETQRPLLVEFITRANHNMILGNFELDWELGHLRYKTSLDLNACALNNELLRQLVFTNVSLMDQYFPGLEAVLTGIKLPVEALGMVEEQD